MGSGVERVEGIASNWVAEMEEVKADLMGASSDGSREEESVLRVVGGGEGVNEGTGVFHGGRWLRGGICSTFDLFRGVTTDGGVHRATVTFPE
mmetsp:Transcript_2802/g.5180  ORF Transcript_2802/g.5180 Transcript_2802/m.5180 type:complete len:93 (+) Transcript_2802:1936-2214(+)|eukprot:CAMPEP_0184689550 /NCGR_PEP_ID=MMETSP0312-20130426/30718_1 /TAXON_ID=31354 /ORGANISM="Compsopogon coeruleus, Strain SAG 36.94" /LENGTH=92 /DNA_ID=CAMNT_0027146911 /DNA_START=2083 /DNA_END=2361 /DNA_ORIENTATION=+